MSPITGIKPSFSGGEFAPSLYSRVDLQKYSTGAKTIKNCIVHPHGGVSNRPGFKYIAAGKTAAKKIRLIPFEFSTTQTYMLEFGEYYCRFFTNGLPITVSEYALDSYTKLLMHLNGSEGGAVFTEENGKTVVNSGEYVADSYDKLLLHGDGSDGGVTITDAIGKTVTNTAAYDSYTKICSHFDGVDAATAYTDPIAGAYTFVGTAQLDTAQYKFSTASLLLDGNSDYVTLPDSAAWDFTTGDFTIDMQVRFNSAVAAMDFMSHCNLVGVDYYFRYRMSDANTVTCNIESDTVHITGTWSWTPSIDTWYHIALVRNGNNLDFYVNGTKIGSSADVTGLTFPSYTDVLAIGVNYRNSAPVGTYFNGWLDEVRISKGIARWTSNFTAPAYPYGQVITSTTSPKFGTASAYLFGAGESLSLVDSADWDFGSGNFTIDTWIKPLLWANENYALVGQWTHGGADNAWAIWLNGGASNNLNFRYTTNGTTLVSLAVNATIVVGTWYHIAIVRNGTNLMFFLNGTQVGTSQSVATDTIYNSPRTLQIGKDDDAGLKFNGYIDELRVSKGIARWTANFTPASQTTTTTAVKKFGTASGYFNGGSYLTLANTTDFNLETADFTVEGFINFETLADTHLIGNGAETAGGWGLLYDNTAKTLAFWANGSSRATVSFTPTVETWYHFAAIRSSGAIKLAIEGSFGGASTYATSITSGYTLTLGKDSQVTTKLLTGWLDEVRITKGLARWIVDFTPPSASTIAYEIVTPYAESDLAELNYTQSADVLYLTHPSYIPKQLERASNTSWSLNDYAFENGPFQLANVDAAMTLAISAITGTGKTLTAVGFTFNSLHVGSLWRLRHYVQGTAVTAALASVTASSSISVGNTWRLITHGTWTGTIRIEKSTDAGSNWTMLREFSGAADFNANTFGTETGEDPFLLRINMTAYTSGTCNVNLTSDPYYREGVCKITAVAVGGATATADVEKDFGLTTATIDWEEGSWSDYRGWPAVVEFHPEDRLVFANTDTEPQTYWMTKSGNYTNFGITDPLVDSDSISSPLPSRKVNGINGLVALTEMLALTLSNEASVRSSSGPLSPTTAYNKVHGYEGSYGVRPLVIGNRAVYVQSTGSVIRDLGFDLVEDSFKGSDLSVFSNHLFTGYTITEMAYQQNPDRLVWAVRSDGKLLSMTYMREQEVVAWSWHDTNGGTDLFESVAVIRGTGYDELWVAVNRGGTRYVERMEQRMASTAPEDSFYVDNGVIYDSTPATTITGLTHLNGKAVSVLADGVVISGKTPANGQITLTNAASVVQVGIAYNSDIETLNIDTTNEAGSSQGKKIKVSKGFLRVLNTRGLYIGPDSSNLFSQGVGSSAALFSGDHPFLLGGGYTSGGRMFIRQSDPLPLTITGIMPEITFGGVTQN